MNDHGRSAEFARGPVPLLARSGFAIAVGIGYLGTAEELVTTALVPSRHHDVATVCGAFRLRRAERTGGGEEPS